MRCKLENQGIMAAGAALVIGALCAQAQGVTGTAIVEFRHSEYTAKPNERSASIALIRAGSTNTAVTVEFATTDGTAIAGADYTAKSGAVAFAAGQKEEILSIPVRVDVPRKAKK